MLNVTTKQAMAETARTLASSYQLVQYHGTTFIPAHWQTSEIGPCGPSEQIWLPMSRVDKRRLGNTANILFANDSEITNFDIMLRQFAQEIDHQVNSLYIRTEEGLRQLEASGDLGEPDGQFHPNTLKPALNTDTDDKEFVFSTIQGWLNSEEDAHSLLAHLSTALSPGWSAVKYVLLIGDGRNGKSVLLNMLYDLFGSANVSNVTRQQMSERLPVVAELNAKLLNIVFDGEMTYIRDSSVEKTLIAGEPAVVRMLYENGNTVVQTNALFLEALNLEPKSRDKSSALQKRLSRFFFPNTYPLDIGFEKKMRSDRMLGALLALMLDHFVQRTEVAEKLQQTKTSLALQVEQNLMNSPVHQFVFHLATGDPTWLDKFPSGTVFVEPLIDAFMAWRLGEGHSELSSVDVKRMMKEAFYTDWKTVREGTKTVRKQRISAVKPDIEALLNQLRGDDNDDADPDAALVED